MSKILKEFLNLEVPESMCDETKEFIYDWMKTKFEGEYVRYEDIKQISSKLRKFLGDTKHPWLAGSVRKLADELDPPKEAE